MCSGAHATAESFIACLSPQLPGFYPEVIHLGLPLSKVATGHVCTSSLLLIPVIISPASRWRHSESISGRISAQAYIHPHRERRRTQSVELKKIRRSDGNLGGTRWRSWLRHCDTNRKVAVSVPDGVTGIFQWLNPSGRTKALGSTQPLTKMSTRDLPWG
jgi:hypothetical protein